MPYPISPNSNLLPNLEATLPRPRATMTHYILDNWQLGTDYPLLGHVDVDFVATIGTTSPHPDYKLSTMLCPQRVEIEVNFWQTGNDIGRVISHPNVRDGLYRFYDCNDSSTGIGELPTRITIGDSPEMFYPPEVSARTKRHYFMVRLPANAFTSFGPDVTRVVHMTARVWYTTDIHQSIYVPGPPSNSLNLIFHPFSLTPAPLLT